MKRLLNIALMAATVCCLSLAVTSCKDDDNDSNNGNGSSEQTDGELAAADRFWAVAANLVSPFDVTDDYADKTFEPTIGQPTDGNTTVRTVNATDIEVAAASFASITGTDISAETTTFTFHDDAVGTLTYNKSADGKSLATVDVSIKQIPGLQRIVFKTQEQMGENAVYDGVPYYSFGDVISRKRTDGVTEYWICIHPAFTKQGITTTQWATLSPLPDANVWTYVASNGKTYALPTKIGQHTKEMQQLAELTYALLDPFHWSLNAIFNKFKAFNDIMTDNLNYINDSFWENSKKQWSELELWQKVFGYDYYEMRNYYIYLKIPLLFLGNGFSWYTRVSNSPTLYQYGYSNGTGQKSNMHNYQYKKVSKKVISPIIELNCKTQTSEKVPYWVNKDFFGNYYPRYIFRTATGMDLFGKDPDIYKTIADGTIIKDVFVYNEAHHIAVGPNEIMVDPKLGFGPVTAEEAKVGNFITRDGRFFTTKKEADNHGGAVAVVAYVGGDKRVESDSVYNGLAIALEPTTAESWSSEFDNCKGVASFKSSDDAIYDFKGMANTLILSKTCNDHEHDAAKACYRYEYKFDEDTNRDSTISQWFLPSVGQWQIAIEGMKQNSDSSDNFLTKFALDNVITEYTSFWTSTPSDATFAYYFRLNNDWSRSHSAKNNKLECLPFLAFKYGDGGSVNPSK